MQEAWYDSLEERAELDKRQAALADQVYDQLKLTKSLIREELRRKVAEFVSREQAPDEEMEFEEKVQVLAMVAEAQCLIDQLERE